jgi:hypothetical protein
MLLPGTVLLLLLKSAAATASHNSNGCALCIM